MNNKKPVKGIFKKRLGVIVSTLAALIFAVKVRAEVVLYGPQPEYAPPPSPGHIILHLLPMIGIAFAIFVVAPIIGLLWYHKRGGRKKWPGLIVRIITILFILLTIGFIVFVYVATI